MPIRRLVNTHYRWVIVAAGGLLGCVAMGSMFSLPVLLLPIVRDTGWSFAGVAAAMTIGFISMALASMVWGTLYDRHGPRIVVLCGSVMVAACLALAARAQSLLAFQIFFGVGVGGASRSLPFFVLLLTNFFCCATHSGPIIHTVSYAVTCGIPMTAAVSIYSVEGFAGMFGRVLFGVLGDRFGAKRVLVSGLLAQAFGTLGYIFASGLLGFYAAATLFGFIYAGVMPLYAVLARENFPLRMMGTVIGGTAMAGSLGMATGPVAGGLIYESLGSYRWLYLGSSVIGLAAFLVSLTFKAAAADNRATT
jgi:MFS family permease